MREKLFYRAVWETNEDLKNEYAAWRNTYEGRSIFKVTKETHRGTWFIVQFIASGR
jgi:hypothetical protein